MVNTFLLGVLSLFNTTFAAMMTQPVLVFFFAALVLGVVFSLVLLFMRTAKKL